MKGCQCLNLIFVIGVFVMISVDIFVMYLIGFCICFVKPQLVSVGGCQLKDLGLFYNVVSVFEGLGKARQTHMLHFGFGFIDVSGKLVWEFVKGCQCLNSYVLFCVFDDFGEVGCHVGFVDVVGNFIWPEENKSRCLGWW